jgi:O-antigen ligase
MRLVAACLAILLLLVAFTPGLRLLSADFGNVLIALYMLAAAPVALMCYDALVRRRAAPVLLQFPWTYRIGVIFLAVQVIAAARGYLFAASPDVRGLCLRALVYFGMVVFAVWAVRVLAARTRIHIDAFTATYRVLWWYCAANLVLWMAGLENPTFFGATREPSQLLALFGVSALRVQFPLAWGVNSFGVIAGVTMAISLVRAAKVHSDRWREVAASAVPFLCLVLMDSRGALVTSFLTVLMVTFARRWSTVAIVAFWALGIGFVVFSEYMPALTFGVREGTTSTFTSRELIWAVGVQQLADFRPELVFGYGMVGQFESGAYLLYEALFKEYVDRPELISLHNTYLQSGLDTGYVGLALLVMFLVTTIRGLDQIARQANWTYSAALAAVIIMAVNGLTEITVNIYQPWLALLLVVVVSMFKVRAYVAASSHTSELRAFAGGPQPMLRT